MLGVMRWVRVQLLTCIAPAELVYPLCTACTPCAELYSRASPYNLRVLMEQTAMGLVECMASAIPCASCV